MQGFWEGLWLFSFPLFTLNPPFSVFKLLSVNQFKFLWGSNNCTILRYLKKDLGFAYFPCKSLSYFGLAFWILVFQCWELNKKMGGGNQEAVKQLQTLMENGVLQLFEIQMAFFCFSVIFFHHSQKVRFFMSLVAVDDEQLKNTFQVWLLIWFALLDLGCWEWCLEK